MAFKRLLQNQVPIDYNEENCNNFHNFYAENDKKNILFGQYLLIPILGKKHRKNCECCPCHSLFKGHKVIVNIVVLNQSAM